MGIPICLKLAWKDELEKRTPDRVEQFVCFFFVVTFEGILLDVNLYPGKEVYISVPL